MSNNPKLPYATMQPIATSLVNRFAANCQRIELAGSLRRQKDMIGDIEIIVIPTSALYAQLDDLLVTGKIRHTEPRKRWGEKLRSFLFDTKSGTTIQVDLFLQPDPATWGVNMMIRTGCSEFSHRMVTKRSQSGWMPDTLQVKDARVWSNGKAIDTPEEEDVFALWDIAFVAPQLRMPDYQPAPLGKALDFTLDDVPKLAFTFADAERVTKESATWPLPTFPGGPGAAARAAIEANGFVWNGKEWVK